MSVHMGEVVLTLEEPPTEKNFQTCTIQPENGQTLTEGDGTSLLKGIFKIDQRPSEMTCDELQERRDSERRSERRVVFAEPVVTGIREIESRRIPSMHCHCYCFGENALVVSFFVMVSVLVVLFLAINVCIQHAPSVDPITFYIIMCILGILCLVTLSIALILLKKCVGREVDIDDEE